MAMDRDIEASLKKAGVQFIRVLWCDNGNAIRAKAIHRGMLADYREQGVSLAMAQQGMPIIGSTPAFGSGLGPVGEVQLIPDWSTLMALPYTPSHARVMGNMVKDGEPWPVCPRRFLRDMAADAKLEGLEIIASFENEFYLLERRENGEIIPTDQTPYCSTYGMDIQQRIIDDIATALNEQGVLVEQYYPESGPGQHEISVLYTQALAAADQQVVFRETVKAIAHYHHRIASFLPKIFPDQAGSGAHLHLSLWHKGENLLPNPSGLLGLSDRSRWFIGGILHHHRALMAITNPIPNSYRRLQPHSWSGAFCCWGLDNKEAAIRVISNPEGTGSSHFEFKTIDAAANPYLALGAIIAAGLDGIRNQLEPPEPVDCDPGILPEEERQHRGIQWLPATLLEAITALQENQVLLKALSPPLAQAYLAVRQAEWEIMKDWDLSTEVKMLLDRY
ncbi:glutamine synthetase family protein [Roseofilum acuticapitatum]|nr:glutamine synthetase family protein [Roseofilum acuticapitatum]